MRKIPENVKKNLQIISEEYNISAHFSQGKNISYVK